MKILFQKIFKNEKYLTIMLILILVILRIPSLFEPNWYDDEGIYSGVANQLRYGGTLYTDGWDNKTPFMYYLFYFLSFFEQTQFFARLLSLIANIGTIFVLIKIMNKYVSKQFSLIVTACLVLVLGLPTLENNIANAENFFIFFTSLGAFLLLVKKKYFYAGLFFGLAMMFKAQPFFEMATIFLGLIYLAFKFEIKPKEVINYISGVSIPAIICVVYFLLKGNFEDFFYSTFLSNISYSDNSTQAFQFLIFENSLKLRFVILLLSLILIFYLKIKRKVSKDVFIISLWFVGALFGATLSDRGYPHYILQIIPASTIFTITYLKNAGSNITQLILRSLILFVLFISFIYFFTSGKPMVKYFKNTDYYNNFIEYSLNNKSKDEYIIFFNSKLSSGYDIAEFINAQTEYGDYVYFVDNNGWFYELSETKSSSRYVAYYHIWHVQNNEEIFLNELNNNMPKYIVVNNNEYVFTKFRNIINYNYRTVEVENKQYTVYEAIVKQ